MGFNFDAYELGRTDAAHCDNLRDIDGDMAAANLENRKWAYPNLDATPDFLKAYAEGWDELREILHPGVAL